MANKETWWTSGWQQDGTLLRGLLLTGKLSGQSERQWLLLNLPNSRKGGMQSPLVSSVATFHKTSPDGKLSSNIQRVYSQQSFTANYSVSLGFNKTHCSIRHTSAWVFFMFIIMVEHGKYPFWKLSKINTLWSRCNTEQSSGTSSLIQTSVLKQTQHGFLRKILVLA